MIDFKVVTSSLTKGGKDFSVMLVEDAEAKLEQALDYMAQETINRIRLTIDSEGTRAGGERYAPLAGVTYIRSVTYPFRNPASKAQVEANRKYRANRRPLVDTGRMREAPRVAFRDMRGPTKTIIIEGAPYAARHEFGTPTVPARPSFHLKVEDVRDFRAYITREIYNG